MFEKKINVDQLKETLEKGERWYKVGENIFLIGSPGWVLVNDVKRNVSTGIKALSLLGDAWHTSGSNVKWSDFKEMSEEYEIFSLKSLEIVDIDMYSMRTTDKEKIARVLASHGNWWDHFIDHHVKVQTLKRSEIRTGIKDFREKKQSDSSATNDLKDIIFQILPEYTMKEFFTVCKNLHYNDTLKTLTTVCMNYSQSKYKNKKEKVDNK